MNCGRKLQSVVLALCVVMLYATPVWAYDNNVEDNGGKAGRDATYSKDVDKNDHNTAIGDNALAGNGGTVTKKWVVDSREWVRDYKYERGRRVECGGHFEERGHFEYPVSGGNNDHNIAIGDSAKAGNGDGNKGNEAYGTNAQAGNGMEMQGRGDKAFSEMGSQYNLPQYRGGNNTDNLATGRDSKAGNGIFNDNNQASGENANAGNGINNDNNMASGKDAKAGNGIFNDDNIAIGKNAKAGNGLFNDGNTALGAEAVAGKDCSYNIDRATAIGNGAKANATDSTAIGANSQATARNSVALGAESQTGARENTVSVGSLDQQRQITNVAAGTEGTDAVNVNQLKGVESSLNTQIDNTNLRLDRVGAMAAAMSGLVPIAYDPERPTQISLGGGSYSGQQAVALGIFHYTKDDVLLNAGYAISGGEQMARVGVTWKLGSKKKAPVVEAAPVVVAPIVAPSAVPTTTDTTVVEPPENSGVSASSTESRRG